MVNTVNKGIYRKRWIPPKEIIYLHSIKNFVHTTFLRRQPFPTSHIHSKQTSSNIAHKTFKNKHTIKNSYTRPSITFLLSFNQIWKPKKQSKLKPINKRTDLLCWAVTLRKLLIIVSESTTIGSLALALLNGDIESWLIFSACFNFCWADGDPIKARTSDFKVLMSCWIWSSTMVELLVTSISLPSMYIHMFQQMSQLWNPRKHVLIPF